MFQGLVEKMPTKWVRTVAGVMVTALALVAGFGWQLEGAWRESRRTFEKTMWQRTAAHDQQLAAIAEAVTALKTLAENQRQEISEHRQEVRELRKEQVEALRELGRAVDRMDDTRYNRSR